MNKKEIVKKLQKNNLLWENFQKWTKDQSMEKDFYCYQDIDQFISLKKEGLNIYWNQ